MRIGRNTGHTFHGKVERTQRESSISHENHHKSTQTSIDVNRNIVLESQLGDCLDVVDGSVWEVRCRSNELYKTFIII